MPEAFVTLACLIGAAIALAGWLRLRAAFAGADRRMFRLQVLQSERRRHLDARQRVAAAQQVTEAVVEIGTQTVQGVHQAIASIPFTILDAIPGVREPAKVVRAVHDTISEGVYAAIGGVNKLVGKGLRTAFDADHEKKK